MSRSDHRVLLGTGKRLASRGDSPAQREGLGRSVSQLASLRKERVMRSSGDRKRLVWLLVAVAVVVLGAAMLVRGPSPRSAKASSHAEAPLIGQDPRAD